MYGLGPLRRGGRLADARLLRAAAGPTRALPLGAVGPTETRTTRTLQPGVTLTRIVRGADAPALAWTIKVSVPGKNPDGGGSTTVVVDGEVINNLSDTASERPVGMHC